MMTRRHTLWLIFTAILFGAMALKLAHIDTQSIWFDEGYSWNAATQSSIVSAANADATNPPLYYALLFVTVHMWGDNEFALRLFSLFIALPVVPLTYQLARRISPAPFRIRSGLTSALIAALIPILWWASQEARMYTLMALLVLIAALAWERLIARPTAWAWIALWLSELAALYTHNSGPVIALWLNVAVLLVWFSRRNLRRPDGRLWIGGQIVVGLLWMPYFVTRFLNLSTANAAISSAPPLTSQFALQVWQSFWTVPYERVAAAFDSPVLAVTLLIGGLALFAAARPHVRWVFVHAALLIAGLIAALIVLGNEYHGRYVAMIAPLIAVAFGAGIGAIKRGWVRLPLTIALAAVCLFGIVSTFDDALPFRHDDARAMVQHYADTLTERDSVIAWSYADRYELAYYWDRLGVRARRITLPEGADLDEIVSLLPTSGDVSLNVWYTQRADYRGMMSCLLEDGTTAPPESFTTYGMTTYTYHEPPLNIPALMPIQFPFSDDARTEIARLEFHGIPNDAYAYQALCMPLALRLIQSTDVDLKALLLVKNSLGDTIASADAIFATADQRTTSSAAAGEMVWAYPHVRLPRGAPPGDYRLYVRVYDDQGRYPTGLIPQSPSGIGHDAEVATWSIRPGMAWGAPSDVQSTHTINDVQFIDLTVPVETRPGDTLRLTLRWMGAGSVPIVTLVSPDARLHIEAPPVYPSLGGGYSLDWRELEIPREMPPGEATFQLEDGTVIGRITVQDVPFIASRPAYDHALNEGWPPVLTNFASLRGYSASDGLDRTQSPSVSLVWQAVSPTEIPYTVFVQVLNAEGQVIAQSDSQPMNGNRPTTGWRAGEWIVDAHTLTWNSLAAPGEATLIAGLYDPITGTRVPFIGVQDRDYVELGRVTVR